jgi:hypothetical protein
MVAKLSNEYRPCPPGLQAGVVALCPHSRLPVCVKTSEPEPQQAHPVKAARV